MHLRESRTSKFSGGKCPRTPVGSKSGLRQIYPPVTLKYPLVQKRIETPDYHHHHHHHPHNHHHRHRHNFGDKF